MVKFLDYGLKVTEFELLSRYDVPLVMIISYNIRTTDPIYDVPLVIVISYNIWTTDRIYDVPLVIVIS